MSTVPSGPSHSGARSHGRAYALQILYGADGDAEVDLGAAAATWHAALELPLSDEAQQFARQLLDHVALRRAHLDSLISSSSRNWRLERMSRVDRNILRLSACELDAMRDVPVRVVINEAVELAKRFGSADSPAFVNGVLDRIAAAMGRTSDS